MTTDINMIMMIVTRVVAFLMREITKKYNKNRAEYIPVQNLLIGIIAGVLIYFSGLNTNILNAILTSIFASMYSGDVYDAMKTKKEEVE